ncbi:MAG: signal peptidase I [Oscillospiraceae bacterium]|nr:signal peptidase I [Oscillospiraceae bacterium]
MREYIRFSRSRKLHTAIGIFVDILDYALLTLFCIILLCIYVFHFAAVQGDSMLPTLQDGDQLLVNALDRDPAPGEIVIINAASVGLLHDDGTPYEIEGLHKVIVKRVIAVGGQELDFDFDKGVVYVDGQALAEPYINTSTTRPVANGAFEYPIMVPEGFVYVMGDNREVSKDSRYGDVGLIPLSQIEGSVLLRIQPSFGRVN